MTRKDRGSIDARDNAQLVDEIDEFRRMLYTVRRRIEPGTEQRA